MVASSVGTSDIPALSSGSGIKVYPNPTNGNFTLELHRMAESGESNVEVFSMHGEKVLSAEISGLNKQTLSLTGKPTGVYVIRVTTETAVETLRIIKQ
jgi:hypothetical protein